MRLLILALLLVSSTVIAQEAVPVNGMFGIPFGSTKETVIAEMGKKGYVAKNSSTGYLSFYNIKFGIFSDAILGFNFYENKFFLGIALVTPKDEASTITTYETAVQELAKKYGPGKSSKDIKAPFNDGGGDITSAIKAGKADLKTTWLDNPQGKVYLLIANTLIVVIRYSDNALMQKASEAEEKAKSDY